MYCTKCGKNSEDGAKFCEHCGAQMETETKKNEKKKVDISTRVIQLSAAVVIIMAAITLLFGGKKVDLSKYVTLTVTGYEGYGTASWEFDSKAFKADCNKKLKFTKKAKEEFGDYTTPCEVAEMVFTGSIDKKEGLSNGDTITFSWKEEDPDDIKTVFKNKFVFKDVSMKVKDLKEIESFDAFADIYIEYTGCEPTAEARVINNSKDSFLQGLNYSVENGTGLSNGDKITVKVSAYYQDDLATYCAENIGKVPESEVKEYTVEGLNAYVTSIEQIPEDFLDKMKSEVEDQLRAGTANWVDEVSLENVSYIGAYVLTRKPGVNYGDANRIFLVYNVGVHEDYSNKGVDNHINYYYYGGFYNVMILEDGTCTADLSNMGKCSKSFTHEIDVASGRFTPTTNLRYTGFKDLESMFNYCVTSYIGDYNYTSTVEDIVTNSVETEETVEE